MSATEELKDRHLSVRVNDALLQRIADHAMWMVESDPRLGITTAWAIRDLIETGLKVSELQR